jgi:hypothetical protein
MHSQALSLNGKEKALVYVIYTTGRMYGSITIFGMFYALLALFAGTPDYSAAITVFTGSLFGYLDSHLYHYFLTHRTEAYSNAFERLTLIWPYRNVYPFSLYKRRSKLFSEERKRLSLIRTRTFIWYESYKIAVLIFLVMIVFLISKRGETILFNCGLSIFFWGLSYILLDHKKYLLKSAVKLGIEEKRLIEIKNYLKSGYRMDTK